MAKILVSHDGRMVMIENDIFQVAGTQDCRNYIKMYCNGFAPIEIISKEEMDIAYAVIGGVV